MKILKATKEKTVGYTRKPKVYREEDYKEIYSSSTMKVVMRNCLALGNFPKMNLEQEKLLGIALANAHSKGEFYMYRCKLTKLAKMIGYSNRNTVKLADALNKDVVNAGSNLVSHLMASFVSIEESDKKTYFINLFSKIVIEKIEGKIYITFKLNNDLKPYVLRQTGNFCILALDLFTKSTSPYSIRLGRTLSAEVMKGERKEVCFSKEELAEILQLPNFYKDNYYETKRAILVRAVHEVNEHDNDLFIEGFSRIADGRSYVGVSFDVVR